MPDNPKPTSSDEVNPCAGCPQYGECSNYVAQMDAGFECERPDRICVMVEEAMA